MSVGAAVIRILFPPGAPAAHDEIAPLLDRLSADPPGGALLPGDPRVHEFLENLSRRLLRPDLARRHPELGSLGFFLRRSELLRAMEPLLSRSDGIRHVPRGLVVHFPPANVDTIFVYSWALSALCGNRNVVRLSARSSGAAEVILDALTEVALEADDVIAATQSIISYDHDDVITAALSSASDLRVIWGGDAAVSRIRAIPLRPLARDLTFPDRSSFAVISVAAWTGASQETRRSAVEGFANDVYWFDQAACSSPRDVCWVGDPAAADAAQLEFSRLLAAVAASRGWGTDHAMAIEKRVSTYGLAATGAAVSVRFTGNAVADVKLVGLGAWQRGWLGAGTLGHVTVDSLERLVPVLERKDQTMSQFGFKRDELDQFVTALGGRALDRIVPFGHALTFARTWDGYDLLREFTRLVSIQT